MKKLFIVFALLLFTGCFGQSFEKRYEEAVNEMADADSIVYVNEFSHMETKGKLTVSVDLRENGGYFMKGEILDGELEVYIHVDGGLYTMYLLEEGDWYKITINEKDLEMAGLGVVKDLVEEIDYKTYLNYDSYTKIDDNHYELSYTNKSFLEELSLEDDDFNDIEFSVIFEDSSFKEMSYKVELEGELMENKMVIVSTNEYTFSVPDSVKSNAIEIDLTN